ncbi:MAG: winged helix-turn-helix transcriptional regulator [Clostridia bacterium]|jgi:ArsR family transcriptional regulator, arsenate/arsenite/antimonite-responsive transcriptional repressor|nr:winged helix-turn-helix transcriptional regulator [Clostridia bacterium]MBT7123140.1 winged helix-turn-helix transcriptional regulator [Clostridia bacterium]
MQYKQYIPIIKALSDETRLKIVDMLSCGELCACKILEAFNITQPTLSYHMKILTGCGLVVGNRDGAWMHYSINETKSTELTQFLSTLVTEKSECICNDINLQQGA